MRNKRKFTYAVLHLNNLQPSIQLRHEVSGSRKRDAAGCNKAPPQRRVLANSFTERSALESLENRKIRSDECQTYLEVDGEGGNLLRKPEQVDRGVQKAGFKFRLKIDGSSPGSIMSGQTPNASLATHSSKA